MKKYLFYILLFFCFSQQFSAQDDGVVALSIPVRNSLKFNRTFINPTFSFVRESHNYISINNKREWAQFDNAPETYLFAYSGRFRERIGAGLSLFQQNYGALTTFGGMANFAYNIVVNRSGNLTFGMNLGFYRSSLNDGGIISNTPDPSLDNIPSNSIVTINPGINYGTEFFDFGLSLNNIVAYNLSSSAMIEENPEQAIQVHGMYTGYMNTRGYFEDSRFSTLVRSEFKKDQVVFSGIMMLTVPKGFWGQIGYNTFYGVSAGVGLNISPQIAVEYNFERAVGDISALGNSHDITLAYRFKSKERYDYFGDEEEDGLFISETKNKRSKKVTKSVTPKNLPRKSDALEKKRAAEAAAAVALAEEKRAAAAAALNGKVEADRLAEKAEADRIAEEKRIQEEAVLAEQERLRKAEEARLAKEAQLKAEQEAAALAEAKRLEEERAAQDLAEQERLRKAEEAKLAEAARLKAEQEAAALAEAERLRKAEEARIAEAKRLEEERAAQALAEQERLRKEEEARLAEEARLKAEQEAAALAEAERLRKAEEARIAEAKRLDEEQAAQALLEQERLRKAEKARLAEEARLKAEQEAAALAEAERLKAQKEEELKAIAPTDEATKLMNNVARSVYESSKEQQQLIDKLREKVESKQQDLDDLIEENNLSEQGIVKAPKPFKSISAENRELEQLTTEIENIVASQNTKIRRLDRIYKERLNEVSDPNDATNKFYEKRINELKAQQVEALQIRQSSIFKIEQLKEEIKEERKRRIKRALYDNDQEQYEKDRAALNIIRQNTPVSSVSLTPDDFDYGEELSNIQILKGINNVEEGYYLVVAVHSDVDKRDEFLRKAVAAGQKDINFFFDVNTSKYYIYYENYDGLSSAQRALEQKGNKSFNGKMSLVKIEK